MSSGSWAEAGGIVGKVIRHNTPFWPIELFYMELKRDESDRSGYCTADACNGKNTLLNILSYVAPSTC